MVFYIGAKIGEGILLDHGTGVVIGETAVIGNRVSMMQVSVFLHNNFYCIYPFI
jgi:serine acetyltransferase